MNSNKLVGERIIDVTAGKHYVLSVKNSHAGSNSISIGYKYDRDSATENFVDPDGNVVDFSLAQGKTYPLAFLAPTDFVELTSISLVEYNIAIVS